MIWCNSCISPRFCSGWPAMYFLICSCTFIDVRLRITYNLRFIEPIRASFCNKFISDNKLPPTMKPVQVEQESYEMPPRDGISIAHFLTVTDIDRSARYYEMVFGG